MIEDATVISQTIFTASITAASLTFIIIIQIMIWIESNIESEHIQGYVKLQYYNLLKTMIYFLMSNILVIFYWLLHSLLFQITSFQIGSFQIDLNWLIIISLLIFLWAVILLLFSVSHFVKKVFTWENGWRIL